MNYFETLNNINVNDKTELRSGLTYLSWAWAWGELKKLHPMARYTIYENADGLLYHHDDKTCWVKTGVTVPVGDTELEHIEYLPVMDYRNKSIPIDNVTSFDVNKAIQRSLTKAVARHGLGLYIYAGEDLPEAEKETAPVRQIKASNKPEAKVTVITPEEIKTRNNILKALLQDKGKTMDEYKAIAGNTSVANIDKAAFEALLVKLNEAWA